MRSRQETRLTKEEAGDQLGLASLEVVLFCVFFLVPVCVLSVSLMQSGAAVHNAIASARHGAFRDSVAELVRWEGRKIGGLHRIRPPYKEYDVRRSLTEGEVKSDIAYYPASNGRVLTGGNSSWISGKADVKATIRSKALSLDYDRMIRDRRIRESNIEYHSWLRMKERNTSHYDTLYMAPMHYAAWGIFWGDFNRKLRSCAN